MPECLRISRAASSSERRGCSNLRLRAAVVPITREQSATASATLEYSRAVVKMEVAPTADLASRKAWSYGLTTRRPRKPKLLIARAAAPMFSGLRVETRTTATSLKGGDFMEFFIIGSSIVAELLRFRWFVYLISHSRFRWS